MNEKFKKNSININMEKSPPRSYKKQQKILNEELTKNARRTWKNFNTNKNFNKTSLLSTQLIEKFAKTWR